MKTCPICKRDFNDFEQMCPICNVYLIPKVETSDSNSAVKLGDANAISGGVHVDSHNVITHNTVVEAQKTHEEFLQENELHFITEVQTRCASSVLDDKLMSEINILAQIYHIPPHRQQEILILIRKNISASKNDSDNQYLADQMTQEIFYAIQTNAVEVVKSKFHSLEQLAQSSNNEWVQFFYQMLRTSLHPESCVVGLTESSTDNYWQLFWGHVAFIKLNQIEKASVLMPRMGAFGAPKGDISLLMSIDNLTEYRKNPLENFYLVQMQQYLMKAQEIGMSEQLIPVWNAVKECMLDAPNPEIWYQFYVDITLKELVPIKTPPIPQMPPSMSNGVKMTAPPCPSIDLTAQSINLSQMQGFNPLQAAQQMELGRMSNFNAANPPMPNIGGMMPPPSPIGAMQQTPFTPPALKVSSGQSKGVEKINQATNAQSKFSLEAFQMAESIREPQNKLDEEDPLVTHYGIIFTDTNILAQKYQCSQQDVCDLFNMLIQSAYEQQMYWNFLDASAYYDRLSCPMMWEEYNDLITSFIQDNNLESNENLHLMIVGGADVIPIPWIRDPYEHGSGSVPCDMCYAFEGSFLEDYMDGSNEDIDVENARNNVARLPLEDGVMSTDLQSDLGAYFNLCGMFAHGIPVGNVVMSSNADWIPASTTMSEHLPLIYRGDDPEMICNGMYVSPKLLTQDESSMYIYRLSIAEADMLMFNLHGADHPQMPGFYSTDEAFNPGLLCDTNARVFNTVACFGARYSGYSRKQSMVLSALYGGGVLLYTGSLISVPMYYDYKNEDRNEARELLLNPGTGSEVFMRLYPLYQFKGMTAGRALLQAKCDYFNMCRHVESDGFSLSTIMMFSLYGNPMLHVRKREHVLESALQNDVMPPAPVKSKHTPFQPTQKQTLMRKDQQEPLSLLQQIQNAVDHNLENIRQIAEQNIYNALGVPPRMLQSIDLISRPNGDGTFTNGYSFNYHNPEMAFDADIFAEVDKNGNVKRVYSNK